MKILGIDSSSLVASVAVVTDDVLTAEFTVNFKKTHSQTLLPMLDQMMAMLGMNTGEMDGIAAAAGPGSFTGLRIGAATAKGLGLALDKPLVEVPTLEALAYNLWGSSDLVCPIMDARRNQVYAGIYRVRDREEAGTDLGVQVGTKGERGVQAGIEGERGVQEETEGERGVQAETVSPRLPEAVMDQCAMDVLDLIGKLNGLGQPVVFLGDGVPVYEKQIRENLTVPFSFALAQNNRQRAASVAALGMEYMKRGKMVTAAEFKVDYLRKSQAEREREERERKTLSVRPMTSDDLLAVEQLERQCFSEPWSVKLLADGLNCRYDRFWVAETGGQVCGYANLRIIAGEGEIERIAVDSRFRRQGIGRKLMEKMEESAADAGAGDITLEVREGNTAARKLYESRGFSEEGRRKEYYRDLVEDAVIMWLRRA